MGAAAEPGRRAALAVNELDRKPSSCPYLYAWNGERFEFVTDFLGAGEMGYYEAPGVRNDPDPVEYVRIAPGQLAPRNGRYELRVTNELEEVLYLDRLRLLAVDHPADVARVPRRGHDVAAEALPPLRGARPAHAAGDRPPRARRDRAPGERSTARSWTTCRSSASAATRRSTRSPSTSPACRRRTRSCSSPAGPTTRSRATTWPRTRRASPRSPRGSRSSGADGTWATAVEQVGIPVGRPQTVVVDLAGRLGPSRRVAGGHDHAGLLGPGRGRRPGAGRGSRARGPRPACAPTCGERGFSAVATEREPLGYDYARVSWLSPWKTMPGRYTREGDVRSLLAATDDAFVVSKPGDEVALSFDASTLPPRRAGADADVPARRPTASARRWTSTPRARTSSCPCRTTA